MLKFKVLVPGKGIRTLGELTDKELSSYIYNAPRIELEHLVKEELKRCTNKK